MADTGKPGEDHLASPPETKSLGIKNKSLYPWTRKIKGSNPRNMGEITPENEGKYGFPWYMDASLVPFQNRNS